MVSTPNKHGLTRESITADVERAVRQRCGFGCAYCGNPISVQYHHFDPPFCDAEEHTAEGIVLLCTRCHTGERSLIPEEEIAEASKDPCALRAGFAEGDIPGGLHEPEWRVGSTVLTQSADINLGGCLIGKIEPPEDGARFFRLSLELRDPEGGEQFKMVRNQIRIGTGRFDVTYRGSHVKGGVIEIRSAKGKIILDLRIRVGEFIEIQRLHARNGDLVVAVENGCIAYHNSPDPNPEALDRVPQPRTDVKHAGIHMIGCSDIVIEGFDFSDEEAGIVSRGSRRVVIKDGNMDNVKHPFIIED